MGYIDAHTHAWFREFLPQNFSSKNAGYEFKPPSLQQVLKEMDSANIDYIVIIAYPARELWNIDESIAIQAIDFLKPYGERFSVVGGIEPNKLA